MVRYRNRINWRAGTSKACPPNKIPEVIRCAVRRAILIPRSPGTWRGGSGNRMADRVLAMLRNPCFSTIGVSAARASVDRSTSGKFWPRFYLANLDEVLRFMGTFQHQPLIEM